MTCILSASVTHEGLQGIVKEYIEYELGKAHDLPGLKVYLFTEAETSPKKLNVQIGQKMIFKPSLVHRVSVSLLLRLLKC